MKKIIITLTILLGFLTQVSAKDLYIFANDTSLTSKDGKVAKLFLGVPVKVLKEKGKNVEVIFTAFLDGNKLYASSLKTLQIGNISKGFKFAKTEGKTVTLKGLIELENLTEVVSEVWEEQEEFFFEMCTQCHAAPAVNHHAKLEWAAIFGTMKGFAKLDKEESSYLLRYLLSNASDGLVKTSH